MKILNSDIRLANILEVSEGEIFLNCEDEIYTVEITEEELKALHELTVYQDHFMVAFNPFNNKLHISMDEDWNEESLYDLVEGGKLYEQEKSK